MGEGLNLALGGRRRRRRRRLAVLAALVLLAGGVLVMRERLGPVWAVLSALPGQVDGLLAEHFVPGYTERLRALRGRNAVLHAALAAAAPLEAENQALRSFVEAPARPEQGAWQPLPVIARSPDGGFTLAGEYAPGTRYWTNRGGWRESSVRAATAAAGQPPPGRTGARRRCWRETAAGSYSGKVTPCSSPGCPGTAIWKREQ